MPLNENQKRCATTFGRSMAVIAGAGSGKTFTLKERIANAFEATVTGNQMEPLTGIEQVLAITFTEKAALELKSRVKATLRERGLVKQAMLVDSAWIGTIHGMCSRILKENALALGIDPAFQVMSGDARSALLDQAMEDTFLGLVHEPGTPEAERLAAAVNQLFDEYRRETLKEMISTLVDAAVKSPDEFDSLEGPHLAPQVARELEAFRAVVARYHAERRGTGDNVPFVGAAALSAFLEEYGTEGTFELADGREASWHLPWWEDADLKRVPLLNLCCLQLRQAEAARLWQPLVLVARTAYQRFCGLKVASGVFDNNDLLIQANHALTRNPGVAALYRDRFRLVLVDEFQDTDQMQLDTIKALAGPNCERLCVVGDPEQSIYRFRGADLAVCAGHLANVPPEDHIHLDDNYRSHADVLRFVDMVFGAEGETDGRSYYQRLKASRDEEHVSAARRLRPGEGPRIEVIDAEHLLHHGSKARRFEAARIAARFEQMHRATGRPYGHMVILLGKMTHADVYAQALDDLGIPCAVTGGSVLARKTDARVMVALARALANPRDSEAVEGLLQSDLFGLDASDLMVMEACAKEAGAGRHSSLGSSFARLVAQGSDGLPERLAAGRVGLAVGVMGRAYGRLGHESVARVMEQVLAESGWLARMQGARQGGDLQAEGGVSVTGQARAADALKVIRMARDLEDEGCLGARAVSSALVVRLDGAKESPGVLSAEGSDFVRIMTIHASKGLQFPVCACAELDGVHVPAASRASCCTVAGHSYCTLDLEGSLAYATSRMTSCAGKKVRELAVGELCGEAPGKGMSRAQMERMLHAADKQGNLAARLGVLAAFDEAQEAQEMERKLYVAFTRAEEVLIVCLMGQASSAELRQRLKGFPACAGAVKLAASKSKKVSDAEREAAKKDVERLTSHVCVSYAAQLDGIPGRIRARRACMREAGFAYRHAPSAAIERWDATGELPPEWQEGGDCEGEFLEFDDVARVEAAPSGLGFDVPSGPMALVVPRQRYAPMAPLGVLSASALHEQDMEEQCVVMPPAVSFDEEGVPEASATERGTAFHLLGEIAARRWRPGEELVAPMDRVHPTALRYGLNRRQEAALAHQVERWIACPVAHAVAAHAHLEPEVPFFVRMPRPAGERELSLTGFVDLLAYDTPASGAAEVVDYKTGRFLDTDDKRRQAYEVQARTYAYALMTSGFSSVCLHFVFVDQGAEVCEFGPWEMGELEEFLRAQRI